MAVSGGGGGVFSMKKLAFRACVSRQRAEYDEWKLPCADWKQCCEWLHNIIVLNGADGDFDPLGDRRSMYHKVSAKRRVCTKDMFKNACKYGHVNCLRMARDIGVPWCAGVDGMAAGVGQLDVLLYLTDSGCPMDPQHIGVQAVCSGKLSSVRYARQLGYAFNEQTCIYAAVYGRFKVLKYVLENGAPWNEETCRCAAAVGRIKCLKYAKDNQGLWDESDSNSANGHLKCLQYMLDNGCRWAESDE